MRIYLVRHGPAGNREEWHGDDALRPLTEKGKQKTRAAAEGLKLLGLGVDTLVTSPLVRAKQTADIVGNVLHLRVTEDGTLSPGFGMAQLVGLLSTHTDARELMLVGHEPDFSELIGQLIAPQSEASVMLKKGACCALELPDETSTQQRDAEHLAGSATLLWLMTARQLGRISG